MNDDRVDLQAVVDFPWGVVVEDEAVVAEEEAEEETGVDEAAAMEVVGEEAEGAVLEIMVLLRGNTDHDKN
jgi:hypothetical protein